MSQNKENKKPKLGGRLKISIKPKEKELKPAVKSWLRIIDKTQEAIIFPGIGKQLKDWRNLHKLKLTELGDQIGVSGGPLFEAENSKCLPSLETIARLHKKTDMNIMWLLFEDGPMNKK